MADASSELPPRIPELRFEGVAGRGGMSTVWRAWHTGLRRRVAVKVLDSGFAASGQDVRQFMLEVRAMSQMDHPGIVRGYDADYADGHYYFIMDYVDGYTFESLLERGKRVSQADALVVCESVAAAMKYAWDGFGIVHCDMKPDNLMVDSDGTVKITDLGICLSRAAMHRSSAVSEDVVGTPAYISPEQIFGDVELDCRADVYSLGATLYHMSTRRILFPLVGNDDMLRAHADPATAAPDPRTIVPTLSANFARLLARMLVKDREQRYRTWDEVLVDAQTAENGGEIAPPSAPSSVRLLDSP